MLKAIIFAAAQFNSLGYPCTQYCDAIIVPGIVCDFRGEKKRCETTGDKCAPGWQHYGTEPSTGQLLCRPPVNSPWKK